MALGAGPVLGLEFGDGIIRAAAARRAQRGYAVAAWAERPAPTGGVLAPAAELAPVLRELADAVRAPASRVVVALSNQHVLLRRVVLPRRRPARLRQMLEEEGQGHIPFLAEGAALDLRVLGPAPEAPGGPRAKARRVEVLLAAVPTRVVHALQEACAEAGLVLAGLELDLVSACRAWQPAEDVAARPLAVVHVGDRRARVAVFHGGQPAVVRSLETAGETSADLAHSIARLLELTLEPRTPPLEHLVLATPGAAADLPAILADVLPTTLGRRLAEEFRISPMVVPSEVTGAEAAAAAFGAALAPAAPPATLDLLPRPSVQQRRGHRRRLALALAGVALLGAYGWWWSQAIPAARAEAAALQAEQQFHMARAARQRPVVALEQQARELQPVLRDMALVAVPLSEAYTRVRDLLPADTVLTEAGGSLPDLRLRGVAPSGDRVDEYIVRLAESELVQEVSLRTTTRGAGQYSFDLLVRLRGKEVEGLGASQPADAAQE